VLSFLQAHKRQRPTEIRDLDAKAAEQALEKFPELTVEELAGVVGGLMIAGPQLPTGFLSSATNNNDSDPISEERFNSM